MKGILTFRKTDSSDPDFRNLVKELDQELAIRDGDDHAFYDQFNKIDNIKYVVVAYLDDVPVGCGAIKPFESGIMEVKRMYVNPVSRGHKIAVKLLQELENWAISLDAHACILETGINQPEAIALYNKTNYTRIENYGQYAGVSTSLCFQKILVH